jgi:hypothetical protein
LVATYRPFASAHARTTPSGRRARGQRDRRTGMPQSAPCRRHHRNLPALSQVWVLPSWPRANHIFVFASVLGP